MFDEIDLRSNYLLIPRDHPPLAIAISYFQFPAPRNDKVGPDGKHKPAISKSSKIRGKVSKLPHTNQHEKKDSIDRTFKLPSFSAPEQKGSGQPSPTFIIKPAGKIHH